MTFIYELDDWPHFKWDSRALVDVLADVRHKQGRLLGRMDALGFDLRAEATLVSLTSEIVKSSAIEGEQLATEDVRSSIARQLGLDVGGLPRAARYVDGIVEMMLDATRRYDHPLTKERLCGWHAALFPTGRSGIHSITVGEWRKDEHGPMQVVSGPLGKERVHFRAPAADRLEDEMNRFLTWFNQDSRIDPVLRGAVSHFWFVTIHPFDDGNGRIARAIGEMALTRSDGCRDRFYSMSSAIEAERSDYYQVLESSQRGSLDITAWLAWFLGCLERALDEADSMLESVLRKARLWRHVNVRPVNDRQRKVINRMLDHTWEGNLTTSKYARMAKCSHDTALRDIKDLVGRGVLRKNDRGGRSTSYRLAEPDDR